MKRFFRPSFRCDYVISEIKGNFNSLDVILNRIIPLRKYKGQEDQIFFLGNYVGGEDTYSVIQALINLKIKYPDRTVFLKGSDDVKLLEILKVSEQDYQEWVKLGGHEIITSYLRSNNLEKTNPFGITQSRLLDLIPKTHISFLQQLKTHFIFDHFALFSGGFMIDKPLSENGDSNFVFDITSSRYVKDCIKTKSTPHFQDDYIYVANNNYNSKVPFFAPNYFMLGGMAPKKILILELNSMKAAAVSKGKSRLYKYNFKIQE